jgi:hypothetical protein
VWNHDKALAVSLENRIIAIMDEERARSSQPVDSSADDPV